ncbi:17S U2 SnRNP complex component HTATSF1 [Amia ocellicauda]|uniref:17S U2 SnRNP complex component HTATSF1 n=1 Tax=Amia ocellicauda TaxID=2972642 RepID=UPI003463C84C|nr:HTSF1 factor [Amia calva]
MSGDSDGNKDFHEQLRLQQLYGQSREEGNDPYTFVDPEDGTVYDWDHDKKAWFPKITDDFLAAYHANYGFNQEEPDKPSASGAPKTQPAAEDSKAKKEQTEGSEAAEPKDGKQKGEKRKPDPGWFSIDQEKNTNVYVSGLPLDVTPDEFVEVMSKCGIIMRDPVTEEYKVKLYKDHQGNLKGDGLCCYLKKESVALAERLLDDSEIRGYRLHVEAARFELKGQYDASKKKKKNKEYRKKLQQQQKQLDWRPEKKPGEIRKRHERVLILRNMFHPSDFEEDPLVLNEIREDLRTECEKFGQVKKVIIFDRHPDGVASVAFKEPEEADVCMLALNGRWFGGRQLSAELWDGTTDYQVEETSREREERLKGWSTFLGDEKAAQESGKETPKDGADGIEKGTPEEPKNSTEEPPSKPAEAGTERPEPGGPAGETQEKKEEEREKKEAQGNGEGDLEETGLESTDSSLAGSEEEEEEGEQEDEEA